jgi:hypothetical protein
MLLPLHHHSDAVNAFQKLKDQRKVGRSGGWWI